MVSKWTYIYHAILHACADKLSVQLYQVQFTHQHVFQEALFFFPSCSSKNLPHNIPQMLLYPVPWCGLRVFYFEIEPVKQMKITHDQLMINFMPHNFRHYSIAQPTVA